MVFIILNAAIGASLIAFSFSVDSVRKNTYEGNALTNMTLFLSAIFIINTVSLISIVFGAPRPLCKLLTRITYMLLAWYNVSYCDFILTYNVEKKPKFLAVIRWIINISALIALFFVSGFISGVSMGKFSYTIASKTVFDKVLFGMFPLTMLSVFTAFFIVILPLFCTLMVLVRAENTKSRLLHQNLLMLCLATLGTAFCYALFSVAKLYQPLIGTLTLVVMIPGLMLASKISSNSEVWGKSLAFRTLIRYFVIYFVPALVEGLIYLGLREILGNSVAFYVLFVIATSGVVVGWVFTGRYFTKMDIMRDSRYGDAFEESITSIDFTDEPSNINKALVSTFKKYVDCSSFRMAIDAGTGYLESIFDGDDDEKIAIPADNKAFDVLLNLKHPVVFRKFAEKDYSIQSVRAEVLELLDSTKSDAFIMLNEGRRIVGIIFLGPKSSGNMFTPYDYSVFTKLYSNFFVVGYYMKNIMNESVVGTVNREIRMSSQIITSIQENMDYITNPKIDCGYRMVPAHNIGGEFIDLIRLNDHRHMFIIGALNGKGIAASMSMVILKSIIRTDLAETPDFKVLVQKINYFIRTSLPKGTFFAGTFGLIDFSTDTMYYINCGSPALFMYNSIYNNVIEIQGEGHVLGFVKDVSKLIRVKKVKLSPNDIVLACTDGLIEARSLRGETFGKTRVQSQMLENSSFPADKMAQFTYENLVQFSSRALEDDITVLILKYKGAGNKQKNDAGSNGGV